MKRNLSISLLFLAAAGFAAAQITTPTTDVLGAHLNYGRGCAACHAPHSGAFGNGAAASADTTSGNAALWGEDLSSLYGKTITSGQADHGGVLSSVSETLPSTTDLTRPDTSGLLMCLSCHDGNYATGAMMKNRVYETLPSTYGTANKIPTLLGNEGGNLGNYLNDHPVGINAIMGCGGPYDWDCTISATGSVQMTGTNSKVFVQNYGFFVSPKAYNNQPTVMCTTCHNQHLMNVVNVTNGPKSGLPSGLYATMFFIRAPYNPASGTDRGPGAYAIRRPRHGA